MSVFELDAATFEQMITNFREDNNMTPSENIYRSDRDVVDDVIDVDAFNEMLDEFNGEDDGQPSEYDEWQDYMGGDDWDYGQCDEW